jgi:hypothetical protein
MAELVVTPERAELTDLVAARARSLSRVPLLLAALDALIGVALARGWSSAMWFPGVCVFSALLAMSVWGLADRALEEWRAVSHRGVRGLLTVVRGASVLVGIGAVFLALLSILLLAMGSYFR